MITAILIYLVYFAIILIANIAVLYHFSKYCFPGDIAKIVVFIYGLVMLAVPVMTLTMVGVVHFQ